MIDYASSQQLHTKIMELFPRTYILIATVNNLDTKMKRRLFILLKIYKSFHFCVYFISIGPNLLMQNEN